MTYETKLKRERAILLAIRKVNADKLKAKAQRIRQLKNKWESKLSA